MSIIGVLGPEGAGKTCLMTRYLVKHTRLGGKLYTFPGYDVYDQGKKVSETLYPEDWVSLPETLNGVAIGIDEADTFFDSLESGAATARMFRNLAKQRRKRKMAIIYTVQDWGWFNSRLRWLTHITINCFDLYWSYRRSAKRPERGTRILFTFKDEKGFYTGKPGTRARPKIFHADEYWNNYDTYAPVDYFEAHTKVNVKRREITVVNGKVVSEDANALSGEMNPEALDRIASNYLPANLEERIGTVVAEIRARGVNKMPAEAVRQLLSSQGMSISSVMAGRLLKKHGVIYRPGVRGNDNVYTFD